MQIDVISRLKCLGTKRFKLGEGFVITKYPQAYLVFKIEKIKTWKKLKNDAKNNFDKWNNFCFFLIINKYIKYQLNVGLSYTFLVSGF